MALIVKNHIRAYLSNVRYENRGLDVTSAKKSYSPAGVQLHHKKLSPFDSYQDFTGV